MVRYLVGGVIRGTNAERLALNVTDLPPNTIFQETDSVNSYDLDGGVWRIRGSTGGGTPALFTKLKKYWVTKSGSTYFIYNKDGNVAQSDTDLQTAIQAELDSLVNLDAALFEWDAVPFTLTNPIIIPVSIPGTTDIYVKFQGFPANQSSTTLIDACTMLKPAATFPTQRYAIECNTSITETNETVHFRCDGFQFNGREFAKSWAIPTQNIFGGGTVVEFGGIKLSHATHSRWPCQITNCNFAFLWRGLHLMGKVWFNTFSDLYFTAFNALFGGGSMIILENGGHSNALGTNPVPKVNHFRNIRTTISNGSRYDNFLLMKSGSYNHFDDIFPDGHMYTNAVFCLDNSDFNLDPGYILAANHYNHITALDLGVPSPDTRIATLYLNGANCYGNTINDARLPNSPEAVRLAGGAANNTIELSGYFGGNAIINDAGAGVGNTIQLKSDYRNTTSVAIQTTNGIARVIDNRGVAFSGQDELISDGTHWWLKGIPSPLSNRKYGVLSLGVEVLTNNQGLLTTWAKAGGAPDPTIATTPANGRRASFATNATTGSKGGMRLLTSLIIGNQDARLRMRFRISDKTFARYYFGFASNVDLTGDSPLDGLLGVILGLRSNQANFEWMRGGTTTSFTDTGVSKDLAILHEIKIVVTGGGTKYSCSINGGAYTDFTTSIPGTTNSFTVMAQSETAENAAKTFEIYNMFIQTEK